MRRAVTLTVFSVGVLVSGVSTGREPAGVVAGVTGDVVGGVVDGVVAGSVAGPDWAIEVCPEARARPMAEASARGEGDVMRRGRDGLRMLGKRSMPEG